MKFKKLNRYNMFPLWSQFKSVRQSNNNHPKIGSYSCRYFLSDLPMSGPCGSSHTDVTLFTYYPMTLRMHWLFEARGNLKGGKFLLHPINIPQYLWGFLLLVCYLLWFQWDSKMRRYFKYLLWKKKPEGLQLSQPCYNSRLSQLSQSGSPWPRRKPKHGAM